jgi:hypothetical protein
MDLTMKKSELNDYLQLAASIGVIIGLVLVGYEIRETNRIAENQAAIDMNSLYGQWTTILTDKDMAELWVKSLQNPDDLSLVDLTRLRAAYITAVQAFETNHFLWQSGGLKMYPESTLYVDSRNNFSGPIARQYFLATYTAFDDPRLKIIREAIMDSQPDTFLQILDEMRPPDTN